MNRKIKWVSGCFDEIELVYEKAEKNELVAGILVELEDMALREGMDNCERVKINGVPLTRQAYAALQEAQREQILCALSGMGLAEFEPSMTEPVITVTLSPMIQQVLGCTMFSILNRLEKIDGTYNALFPKATLRIQAPLGGKKGLVKCEMLIMQLYPWLSINEVSTNQASATLPIPGREDAFGSGKKTGDSSVSASPEESASLEHTTEKKEKTLSDGNSPKRGLFKRLFGSGTKKEADQTGVSYSRPAEKRIVPQKSEPQYRYSRPGSQMNEGGSVPAQNKNDTSGSASVPGKLPDNIECVDGRFYLKASRQTHDAGQKSSADRTKPSGTDRTDANDSSPIPIETRSRRAAGNGASRVCTLSDLALKLRPIADSEPIYGEELKAIIRQYRTCLGKAETGNENTEKTQRDLQDCHNQLLQKVSRSVLFVPFRYENDTDDIQDQELHYTTKAAMKFNTDAIVRGAERKGLQQGSLLWTLDENGNPDIDLDWWDIKRIGGSEGYRFARDSGTHGLMYPYFGSDGKRKYFLCFTDLSALSAYLNGQKCNHIAAFMFDDVMNFISRIDEIDGFIINGNSDTHCYLSKNSFVRTGETANNTPVPQQTATQTAPVSGRQNARETDNRANLTEADIIKMAIEHEPINIYDEDGHLVSVVNGIVSNILPLYGAATLSWTLVVTPAEELKIKIQALDTDSLLLFFKFLVSKASELERDDEIIGAVQTFCLKVLKERLSVENV